MKLEDLHNNKNTGFKTPEDFFETFENSIINQTELKSQVTSHGFKVPINYFNDFDSVVLNKIKTKPAKVIKLYKNTWLYSTSIAATIILLFTLTFTNKHHSSFDSLNNESLESFILNQELNTNDMATLIPDTNFIANKILEDAISDSSIEHYLKNEIEIEDLNDN